MIPDPVIEEIEGITVVRDDLIAGGTKIRAIEALMNGKQEYVYASPASGYAQIALAIGCAAKGRQATVFTAKRKEMHRRTLQAKEAGAKIVQVPCGYLTNVQAKARAYAELVGACLLPFGFDSEEIRDALAAVAKRLPIKPKEVWTVAGSGTLSRALQATWPQAIFYAVRIGREPNVGCAKILEAPEAFDVDAKRPPPFPSCSNYDAKAWRFIKQYASPGALFWNVAA